MKGDKLNFDSKQHPETEKEVSVLRFEPGARNEQDDYVALEEPMEIRVVFGPDGSRKDRSLAITMRTPDFDFELAAGFLLSEGIITGRDDVSGFEFCGSVAEGRHQGNIVRVELATGIELDIKSLQRHFYTTSSCGICGKGSIDAVQSQGLVACNRDSMHVDSELINRLPVLLRESQTVFHRTGGIHAAGLFDGSGTLLVTREDIGRHNSLDKLIGNQLLENKLPLAERILVLSGRTSFELVQKALVARIPMVIAVGAPSSLAVDLAQEFSVTLIGFVSGNRFNVYSHPRRIV